VPHIPGTHNTNVLHIVDIHFTFSPLIKVNQMSHESKNRTALSSNSHHELDFGGSSHCPAPSIGDAAGLKRADLFEPR
jgi:hypothetical protein